MDSLSKDIVEAIRNGKNEFVLNRLYKEVLPKIRKFILTNSGSNEDANDIFQDAVIILFKQIKLDKYDASKDISGFMYSISRNLWITKAKRSNKFLKIRDTELLEDSKTDALSELINEEKTKAIEEIMDKIGPECKKLLKFSIYDKLSMKEIAGKMGYSSEEVAKTYNYRCKKKFVEMVKNSPYILALFKK